MYIQLNNHHPTGNIFATLPAIHWLAPNLSLPVTTENAKELGYIDVESYIDGLVTQHIKNTVTSRHYANLESCAVYALTQNAYQTECLALIEWASQVWAFAIAEQDKIKNGERADVLLISELPTFQGQA